MRAGQPDRVGTRRARSPRTSVRSPASIATSVPVPIAMPRSACGQRGRVVDAVADHRDRRGPRPAAARSRSTLSAGSTPAIDLVDADLGGHRVARPRRLSPVSSTGCSPSAAQPRRPPRRRVGLTVSATASDAAGARRPRRRRPRSARASAASAPLRASAGSVMRRARRAAAAGRRATASARRRPRHAEARAADERPVDRRAAAPSRACAAPAIAARDRVLGGVLQRRRPGAARRRASSPSAATTSTSVIRPVVTVPVLSRTTVSTRRVDSSTSGPLIRMPSWAPRPVPTSSAVGVARPERARAGDDQHGDGGGERGGRPAPAHEPDRRASPAASAITTGTNTPETRSASRCTSALPFWASATSRAIWASWVSAPTRVARTTSRPPALTVRADDRVARRRPRPARTRRSACDASTARGARRRRRRRWRSSRRGVRRTRRRPRASADRDRALSTPSRSTATSFAPELEQRAQRRAGPALGAGLE